MSRKKTNATSEVGSNPLFDNIQQMFRDFFSEQSNSIVEMVRTLKEPDTTIQKNVCLPKFDLHLPDADAVSWCAIVDLIFAEKPLNGSALISALSSALMGEASLWLTQICFPGITWPQFKDIFLQRFSSAETSAGTVMNWLNSQPKKSESISAYGNRLVNALESKWKNMSVEKIAVSVALAHLTRIDNRLQRVVHTTEMNSRADMQQELKAYSYIENNVLSENTTAKKNEFFCTSKMPLLR